MAIERMCIHNGAITCSDSRCSAKCGWNPRGETARLAKIENGGLTERDDGIRRLVLTRGADNEK